VKLKLGGRKLRALTLLVDGAPVRSVAHPNTGMLTLTLKTNELGDLARGPQPRRPHRGRPGRS
jgi:hypothetical protein